MSNGTSTISAVELSFPFFLLPVPSFRGRNEGCVALAFVLFDWALLNRIDLDGPRFAETTPFVPP
ncbi:hypothetical protein TorRG33x02_197730 [Trema orientale]|uniref:Uncharacterized protein n=1 Tax=Trema orientale TaxID=63057 RepID=A0A2P5EFX0_TREOI|nr:hypothetical protein TorRG33x02_197730 [Trema orientale]